MHGTTVRPARWPSLRLPPAQICDTSEGANEEHNVLGELRRAGAVFDPGASGTLVYRPAVGVEQPLKDGHAHRWRVVQVALRHELGARSGAHQAQLAQGSGDRIGHDHAAAMPVDVTEAIVVFVLPAQLNGGQRVLERLGELWVLRGEGRCGRSRDASVAQQQSERIRIERNILALELHRLCYRQLEAALMVPAEVPDHLLRLE